MEIVSVDHALTAGELPSAARIEPSSLPLRGGFSAESTSYRSRELLYYQRHFLGFFVISQT
jgi:hypothetical protein